MEKESLQASISHFDKCEKYRIDKTLRRGSIETTEIVFQIAADGSQSGPFIRKHFNEPEVWDLYKRIYDAQVSGLRETGLPRIQEIGEDAVGHYSVIEYINGSNLREAGELDPFSVFESTCKAVNSLHEKFDPPIIHRDIKPDNVIAVSDGVVLIDFGAARTYDDEKDRDTHLYATRAYASPEQFGFAQTDRRSDIYSLGMLLVFLETGKDPSSKMKNAAMAGAEALRAEGLSKVSSNIVARACAFDPCDRFSNIGEMLECLYREKGAPFDLSVKKGQNVPRNHSSAGSFPPPNKDSWINVGSLVNNPIDLYACNSRTGKGLWARASYFRESWKKGALKKAGIGWDIAIVVVWGLFLAVSISLCADTGGSLSQVPVPRRLLDYLGIAMPFITACAVLLADWRPIRSIKGLSKVRKIHVLAFLLAVFVISLLIVGIFY